MASAGVEGRRQQVAADATVVCFDGQDHDHLGTSCGPNRLDVRLSVCMAVVSWLVTDDEEHDDESSEHSNNDLWMDETRVGELGGNGLGFFGGMIGPEGQHVLAYGYNGGFHLWKQLEQGHWEPQVTVSGHFGTVSDVTWHQSLPYLISVRYRHDATPLVHHALTHTHSHDGLQFGRNCSPLCTVESAR